uniref:Uncharacterized protein n=1 Tax=Lepeophtheirus salmonis TaxID=72036 RepID=A0A0K2T0D9_LEPSM
MISKHNQSSGLKICFNIGLICLSNFEDFLWK